MRKYRSHQCRKCARHNAQKGWQYEHCLTSKFSKHFDGNITVYLDGETEMDCKDFKNDIQGWIEKLNKGQSEGVLHQSKSDSSNYLCYTPAYHSDSIQIHGNYSSDEILALGKHMKHRQDLQL